MSIGNGDRADRLHQRNMPEQQETTSEVLFLYKKYPVNSVLESKKTVAEGLLKKNSPEKNFANANSGLSVHLGSSADF